MSGLGRRELVLYGRPECHLCDEARELVRQALSDRVDVVVREVDIEGDDALFKRFVERIPVLELDGHEVGELVIDPRALADALLHTSPA